MVKVLAELFKISNYLKHEESTVYSSKTEILFIAPIAIITSPSLSVSAWKS